MNENFDLFHPTPAHRDLRELAARFAEGPLAAQAREFDEKEDFNAPLFRRLGEELELFGITVPEEEGGLGLDSTAYVILMEEFSRFDPGFTLSYLAHEVLFVHNIRHFAPPRLREKYIASCLSGDAIGGIAMTEPGSGTDVLGMGARAVRTGDSYVLNGTKQFITNGSVGDLFIVYAKSGPERRDISAFIAEKGFPGFSVGKKEEKMGMKSSPTSQIVFTDMQVPLENRIGEENGALEFLMRNLETERIALAAQSLGMSREALAIMRRYALEREAFGKPLYEFGQIQRLIAESYASYQAARALVYNTALAIRPDRRNSLDAAAAKLVASQTGEIIARNALQVLGGYGYTREYPLERLLRDAILISIGGGTNEAMQKNIASDLRKLEEKGA